MSEPEISIFPEKKPLIYASFGQRLGAAIIDGIIVSLIQLIIDRLSGANDYFTELQEHGSLSTATLYAGFANIIVAWVYEAGMTASDKRATLGKMALGIEVTNMNGNGISFANATGRHFAKIVSMIIIFIGYFMMLWDDRSQTLHDKMASTLVVKKRPEF